MAAWAREKAALAEAIEEQRHQIRQEYAKERAELQNRFQEQLEEFRRALTRLEKGRDADSAAVAGLAEVARETRELVGRPESAKDELVLSLEREKRDLLKALQDRSASLRQYALERRDVERSLGESVMDLTRQLEEERKLRQPLESKVAELELRLEGAQRREKLHEAVVVERNGLLQAVLDAAAKAKDEAASRAESEKAWEARLASADGAAAEERRRREEAERRAGDLQSKIQTLSDHIAQILRDKERAEGQFAQWKDERERFLAELQKKEELLSMLSSTFQGLLKK
jgi:hypothetical protein